MGRWDQVSQLRLDGNPWVCDCENQWIVDTLLPTLERADPKFGLGLRLVDKSLALPASASGLGGRIISIRTPPPIRLSQRVSAHRAARSALGHHPGPTPTNRLRYLAAPPLSACRAYLSESTVGPAPRARRACWRLAPLGGVTPPDGESGRADTPR